MERWRELLETAEPGQHVVQLYDEDDQLLTRNVSRYLAAGMKRGDGLLVLATGEHARAIDRQLREEEPLTAQAVAEGRLLFLDAREMLERLVVDGAPDRHRFERVIGDAVRQVRTSAAGGHVRAFGEMVGLLWADGQHAAALQLEEYWNQLLKRTGISLFCAYGIDMFSGDSDAGGLDSILGAHTHLFAGRCTILASPATSR